MHDEKRVILAEYRLARAEECMSEAEILLNNGCFNGSATRSYYAIFNSLRAVLALEGVDFKKHSAVISHFQKEYVKTGVFSNEISDYVKAAFTTRNDSDYTDYYIIPKGDAEKQIDGAKRVIEAVRDYLSKIRNNSHKD